MKLNFILSPHLSVIQFGLQLPDDVVVCGVPLCFDTLRQSALLRFIQSCQRRTDTSMLSKSVIKNHRLGFLKHSSKNVIIDS